METPEQTLKLLFMTHAPFLKKQKNKIINQTEIFQNKRNNHTQRDKKNPAKKFKS